MSEATCSFSAIGYPMPKGSLTRMPGGQMIPAGTTVSRQRVAAWREDIRAAAIAAMGDRGPFKSAIRLRVDITLPFPQTLIRKYQMGWWPHTKKPDVDKLLRAIMDHLTGIVWVDDSQVISVMLTKSYAWDSKPGANVDVTAMGEDELRQLAKNRLLVSQLLEGVGKE